MTLTKENYVDQADRVIKEIKKASERNKKLELTTSKIRNLLSMTADLYNDARHIVGDKLDSDMISRVQYLKMHYVYEAGREQAVKNLLKEAELLQVINEIKASKEKLIMFCHYMEALVAYHRFYGGKDQ